MYVGIIIRCGSAMTIFRGIRNEFSWKRRKTRKYANTVEQQLLGNRAEGRGGSDELSGTFYGASSVG